MPIIVDSSIVELAESVDRLGREGLKQEEIAERLGYHDKKALRRKLEGAGLKLSIENCVRLRVNGKRLSELLEAGTVEAAA